MLFIPSLQIMNLKLITNPICFLVYCAIPLCLGVLVAELLRFLLYTRKLEFYLNASFKKN